ncbi:MAG: acyl carrier protein [Defluviitaleaceae bacterium]|nr:acyl carrier protein [Defluviitaleaceae bacterium]
MKKQELISYIKEELGIILEMDSSSIDEYENFLKLGLSSLQSLKIVNRLQNKLDIEINPIAMFEYKSIDTFAEYLSNNTFAPE